MESASPYRVFGLHQSFFTRKLAGYLDYKRIPWVLRRFGGGNPAVIAAGWPGGIPAVLPPDPLQRMLCYIIEDMADEWLYRAVVGTRWYCPENTAVGGFELAREIRAEVPASCDQVRDMVRAHMESSCPPMGVSPDSIDAWVGEVLKPWLRVLGAHLDRSPFLFGARPSLADFALFGGNAAHLLNDPLCHRWTEEESPAVLPFTDRLLEPEAETFGDWNDPADVPETMLALVADLGRLYLPWVSRATVEGAAEIPFSGGRYGPVQATEFLKAARGVLLARYVEHRCAALDAILERAGIRAYFADEVKHATAVPDYGPPPRARFNRPFPASSG